MWCDHDQGWHEAKTGGNAWKTANDINIGYLFKGDTHTFYSPLSFHTFSTTTPPVAFSSQSAMIEMFQDQ
jgi:hypothetical protein